MQESVPALPRRLNGRAAACDPCRARKLACDHTQPVCKRCRKRGNDLNCIYREPARRGEQSSRRTSSISALSSTPLQHRTKSASSNENASVTLPLNRSALSNAVSDEGVSAHQTRAYGYWGYLSHNALYDEAKTSLSMFPSTQSSLASHDTPLPSARLPHPDRPRIRLQDRPSPLREMCLFILRNLQGQHGEKWKLRPTRPSTWGDVVVNHVSTTLSQCLDQVRHMGEAGLVAVAEMLCDNTAQPMRDDNVSHLAWLEQFSGPKLRWEAVGLLWLYLDRVSDLWDAVAYHRLEWVGEKPSKDVCVLAVKYCIEVATQLSEASVLLVDLIRRAASQDSILNGDARMGSHKFHAMSVMMLNFLGMHAHSDDGVEPYQPTFCSEYQRRLVAQIFLSDKLGVAFTGRPPAINRRYLTTPLPLDLSDEELFDPERLEVALGRLNSHGWNADGQVCSATILRARASTARIRDELYEVALGQPFTATPEFLLDLMQRHRAVFDNFPEALKLKHDEINEPGFDPSMLYIRVSIELERLQTQFFIYRLLCIHNMPPIDSSDLLVTSFTMLTLVVKLWALRDCFDKTIKRNFAWYVMSYGAPAGGYLCLELLRPTFAGTYPKDPSITRSSIIQNLTLLVSFLDWISPSGPNSDLCAESKVVIQRVLDHHLNNPLSSTVVAEQIAASTSTLPQVEPFDESLGPWMASEDLPIFNFQLMDTFDWLRHDTC